MLIAILFGGVFVVCGLFAIGVWRRLEQRKQRVAIWPKARGRITNIAVRSRADRFQDSNGAYVWREFPFRIVKYTYDVGGDEHTGVHEDRLDNASTGRPLTEYQEGQVVDIIYDPAKPSVGYLEMPIFRGGVIIGVMGVVFVMIGVVAAAFVRF